MILKKKSVKKLASLSAFGTGALILGAPQANAGVVSGTINAKVGFDTTNGFTASYISPSLGAGGPNFRFDRQTINGAYNLHQRKVNFGQTGGLSFGVNSALRVFAAGADWSSVSAAAPSGIVAQRYFGLNAFSHSISGNPSFSNQY